MLKSPLLQAVTLAIACTGAAAQTEPTAPRPTLPYCVVDSGLRTIYGAARQLTSAPGPDDPFYGQDAQFRIHPASFTLSADGLTVYDNNTGLTWQRSPSSDGRSMPATRDKMTLEQAQERPAQLNAVRFGGYSDWRLPTIKELYSLIDMRGTDPSGYPGSDTSRFRPFIDTRYFKFSYGIPTDGERIIDSQYASSTAYGFRTGLGVLLFGVNMADGRIKGYGVRMPGGRMKTFYVQCVRGNPRYGVNDLVDNSDGTVSDRATGLMWEKSDSGSGMVWQQALARARSANRSNYLGHSDWRLPSVKELESIVDYSRAPDTTGSAAISPLFNCTPITNEGGQPDFGYYWSATSHGTAGGRAAAYVAFGRGLGYMMGAWRDVHGAGCQRSDPKVGNPAQFPYGRGPQGDAIRIYNYVRLVRTINGASVQAVAPDLTPLAGPGSPGGGEPGGPERYGPGPPNPFAGPPPPQ